MTQRGNLIVLEGVDGSGTTTQLANVARALRARGQTVHQTAQPSELPTGKLIRQILQGHSMHPDNGPMGGAFMALMFAADRQAQQEVEIAPRRLQGTQVLCDRYVYSSVIYQSMQLNDASVQGWIKEINRYITPPEITFFLKIDAQTAEDRRKARDGDAEEIFDKRAFQERLIEQYNKMGDIFAGHSIVTIDGCMAAHEITNAIMDVLEEKGIAQ